MILDERERTVLRVGTSEVELDYADPDHVRMLVTTQPVGPGAYAGAALVCEAVSQAREHHARHLDATLDGSSPACGIVLDALHARIGYEVGGIAMHRAGSSVLVGVDLLP